MIFSLPPSDSWGWLQPESPCGSRVLGKSPRRLQGFRAHFSLERAKSSGGWWGLVKKAWLGIALCHVSPLYRVGRERVRVWCVCVCVQSPGDGSDPSLQLSLGRSQRVKTVSGWALMVLPAPACPIPVRTMLFLHEKIFAEVRSVPRLLLCTCRPQTSQESQQGQREHVQKTWE